MDRYDRVIRDIQNKTDEQIVLWSAVHPGRYAHVVLNVPQIIRAFRADYPIAGRHYELLFLERGIEHQDDFGYSSERETFDLLILDASGQLVLSLYDGVVDRGDLLKLSGLIEAYNDQVTQFFTAFDEAGAT